MTHMIQGNVGKVEDMRHTGKGTAVISFSVASTVYLGKNDDGSKKEQTTWWKVTAWEDAADMVARSVVKGQRVTCFGRISAEAYPSRDGGDPKASLVLTLDKYDGLFIAPARDGASSGSGNSVGGYSDYAPPPQELDDIPF
jgi:single stranded DNA-binding protein